MTTETTQNTTVNSLPRDLLGAWHLVSFYIESSDGTVSYPFGESPQGALIYTDSGDMSATLMASDRPVFQSDDQLTGTTEEIETSFKNCVAYYGKYEVDVAGGFVIHHVTQSLFPNWNGKPQKRFFQLNGNQLRITTAPLNFGGIEKTGVLLWQR